MVNSLFIANILCLIIWIFWFVHGIYCCVKGKEVNKIGYICAVIVCVLYFIEQIISG